MCDTIGQGNCCSFCHVYKKDEHNKNFYCYSGSLKIKHMGGYGAEWNVFSQFLENKGIDSSKYRVVLANKDDEIPYYIVSMSDFMKNIQ